MPRDEQQSGNLGDRDERFGFIDETRAVFVDVPDQVPAAEVERAAREAREELLRERSLRG